MRYLVLAAARVFRRTIATNIYGVNCAARSIVQPATRLFARFRNQLPKDSTLCRTLGGVVQIDESYFDKKRSKQPQHIVVGAKDTTTGAHCPTHYRQPGIDNRLNNLFRITS